MEKNDTRDENHAKGPNWDWDDDFRSPVAAVSVSRIKDPDEVGEAWHPCRDFIDHLADELEEWLSKPEPTAKDIESLGWFGRWMDDCYPGSDPYCLGWNRTKTFLMLNAPTNFLASFEDDVRSLANEARKALDELKKLPLEGKGVAQSRYVIVFEFVLRVVEPCLTDLRHISAELQRRWPIGPPPTEALGERARLALTVLKEDNAFDPDHRMTTANVAVKAIGATGDENQFKEVIADLKNRGYVDTKEGRGGGCWLTDSGRKRAEKL